MKQAIKYIMTAMLPGIIALGALLSSCSDQESYANLLKVEEKATNWYMAQHKICLEIPEDSVFETGPDAPYYKMDEAGYLYMQVLKSGDRKNMPEKNARVLFRYMRMNIKSFYLNGIESWEGNANDMAMASSQFFFKNFTLESSQRYGSGIQTPVSYLGYDCEVNLVLRSYYGFANDQSRCQPYALHIKYYKAEY